MTILQAIVKAASLIVCLMTFSQSALAFSYVMMRDGDLLRQSELVIQGTVTDVKSLTNDQSIINATLYTIQISETIKGNSEPAISVRVPGARDLGSDRIFLEGAPRFYANQDVLLFLSYDQRGYYQPQQYALGAFAVKRWKGERYAVRNLYGTDLAAQSHRTYKEPSNVRSLDRFNLWLKTHAATKRRPSASQGERYGASELPTQDDYFITDPLLKWRLSGVFNQPFTLISSGTSFRWTAFDSGDMINWYHNGGASYVSQIAQAIAAWGNAAGSNISMNLAGSTTASSGLGGTDAQNTILFGDPNNEIPGAYDCSVGGTLGIGGPFSLGVHSYNGTTFNTTVEGDVVINDDAECFLDGFGKANAAEIVAHEVGHTLGFGHSCGDASSGPCDNNPSGDNEALMRSSSHDDGRGASLGSDDIVGAAFLYTEESFNNDPPIIGGIEDQTIEVNGSTGSLDLLIDDPDGDAADLSVSVSANNETLVPPENIIIAGTAPNLTIMLTPANNRTGTAIITINASDEFDTSSIQFSVIVEGALEASNINDSGSGSLRSAIASASENDVISFTSANFPQDSNINNNPQIQLDTPLDIVLGLTLNGDVNGDGVPDVTIVGSDGGSMHINTSSAVSIHGLVLSEGNATQGGAVHVNGGANVAISDSTIRNNSAESGGGIYINVGSVTISNSILSGNVANEGGGITLEGSGAQVIIEQSSLQSNIATGDGGAILNAGGEIELSNTTLSGNESGRNGGGIVSTAGGLVNLNNVTMTENIAPSGAGLSHDSGSTSITNSIISNNVLEAPSNSLVPIDDFGADVSILGGSVTLRFSGVSDIAGEFVNFGDNVLATDMMLESGIMIGGKTIYPLQASSPAIDAGDNNTPGLGGTCDPLDIEGKARPIDGDGDSVAICDMGAYESLRDEDDGDSASGSSGGGGTTDWLLIVYLILMMKRRRFN